MNKYKKPVRIKNSHKEKTMHEFVQGAEEEGANVMEENKILLTEENVKIEKDKEQIQEGVGEFKMEELKRDGQNIEMVEAEKVDVLESLDQEMLVDFEEPSSELKNQMNVVESSNPIDFSEFIEVPTNTVSRSTSGHGGLTIVNSIKNGKRVTLVLKWWTSLNNPDYLKVLFGPDAILIMPGTADGNSYKVNGKDKKPVIYSSALVNSLTTRYNLDFSNGRTSRSFDKIRTEVKDNEIVLVIQMV